MAAKTTLNAKNLETLGVSVLAELLIEISTGSAAHKRRLRLALAGSQSSIEVSREVRKRLSSIARSRTRIDWRRVKALRLDLETQKSTITQTVAADDPDEALELLWQFLALADPIFERSTESGAVLIEIFHQACADAGVVAQRARIDHVALAERVFRALRDNDYSQYDPLIPALASALGDKGLGHLRELLTQWKNEPNKAPDNSKPVVVGWDSKGPVHAHPTYLRRDDIAARTALQEIADIEGDVDAYIAEQPEQTRKSPAIAADIATRLLASGRQQEALTMLDAANAKGRLEMPFEWQRVRLETLEALDRADEAQAYRWRYFEHSLNIDHLRAFLRRLPDFDDMEAEDKAFAFTRDFPDIHLALAFFIAWPKLDEAAKLVVKRRDDLDGDDYELLSAAAETLQDNHPLAATILLRAMIDFALDTGRVARYKHAARHLSECGVLAQRISDFASIKRHEAYIAGLRREHGNKHGFWKLLR